MSADYDKYLEDHIKGVKICYKLLTGKKLKSHDNSKFLKGLYDAYDQYFYGEHPNESQFDYAWLVHQNKEPHHWQYWVLIKDSGQLVAKDMPDQYICEMIADWASFALKNRDPDELTRWYNGHYSGMILHGNTKSKVERLIPVMVSKMRAYLRTH